MTGERGVTGLQGVTGLPDAVYLVLASRLVPGLDGGFTVATLARARMLADAGAQVEVLTVDPASAADHAEHRAEFVRRGLLAVDLPLRNLFDEAADPDGGPAEWVRAAARPCPAPAGEQRRVTDARGRAIVDLPVLAGDPDWHLSTAPVVVYGGDGEAERGIGGFGALYRAWLTEVVRRIRVGDPAREVVVVCESRQLGELIVGLPGVRIVHTVHTSHLQHPYTADAPVNALWQRWLAIADRFDAVLWPTPQQRDEVVARFALDPARHAVVPHAVEPGAPSSTPRTPGRVVTLGRLAPGKRLDHAIRAAAAVPEAALDLYGEGAERETLQRLIDELGVADRVFVRGATDAPGAVLDDASALLWTSAYEGQGLALAEALAHGCPVVSYDIRYGPRDLLDAGGGILVTDGDESALAEALRRVLTDPGLGERLSAEARVAASSLAAVQVSSALADALRTALAG